jgi:hypothetical protein
MCHQRDLFCESGKCTSTYANSNNNRPDARLTSYESEKLSNSQEESLPLCPLNECFFFGGVGLSPIGTVATSGLLYKPQMIDEDDCGAIGGMKTGRGN